jgi:hypothetical protein
MTRADEIQLDLMRRASTQERAALALRLSDETIALARRAIDRAWPELDAWQRKLKFIEVHYGPALAARLAHWRETRDTPR